MVFSSISFFVLEALFDYFKKKIKNNFFKKILNFTICKYYNSVHLLT